MTTQQPLPEGYRIKEFFGMWVPEKWNKNRSWWETFIVSHPRSYDTYKSFKTYKGAYRFLMREIEARKAREAS